MKYTQSIFEKLFLPPVLNQEFNVEKYLEDLNAGVFEDQFCLGVLEQNSGKWFLKNFSDSPNALFIGKMGSGKSQAAKFTLFTWMLANSHKTQLFIIDTLKGAGDYAAFFRQDKTHKRVYGQVYEALESIEKAKRIIDLLWGEYEDRQKMFKTLNASSLKDYERKTGKTINRCVTLVEEAYNLFTLLNFEQEIKTPLSSANKLWTLLKVGRSAGIWFLMCSQKGTKSDIPSQVVQNFTKLIFKTSGIESQYLISSTEAALISEDEKGRCLTENGYVQYPIVGGKDGQWEDQLEDMMDYFIKPLEGEFAFLTREMIKDVIEGDSLKEFYKNKKLEELMLSIESNDANAVISVMHEKMGHQVTEMETAHPLDLSHIIEVSKDVKIAVITRAKAGLNNVTSKHLGNIVKAMNTYECTSGFIYSSTSKISPSLRKMADNYKTNLGMNIEIVDHEDLVKFAIKIDKDGKKIHFDPTKVADDEKEQVDESELLQEMGEEDEDYLTFDQTLVAEKKDINSIFESSLSDVKKDDSVNEIEEIFNLDEDSSGDESEVESDSDANAEAVPEEVKVEVKKIEEPIVVKKDVRKDVSSQVEDAKKEIESIFNQKNTLTKIAKKIPTKKVFTLKKDATPSLMVHVRRNDSGDLYRMIFNVIEDSKVKHQFYVDRQVVNQFSHKEKSMLEINSVDEWNAQKDVLDPDKFDVEVMSFLENFQPCQFPVHSICWKNDVEVLKRYLKPCPYMIDNPQTFEDIVYNNYGLNYSRKEMVEHYSIKNSKNPTIYSPIDIDFSLWIEIN